MSYLVQTEVQGQLLAHAPQTVIKPCIGGSLIPTAFCSRICRWSATEFKLLTGELELGLRGRPTRHRPELARDWDKIILTAMREKPSMRFQSADEMIQAVKAVPIASDVH